jgi:hypothetical protein
MNWLLLLKVLLVLMVVLRRDGRGTWNSDRLRGGRELVLLWLIGSRQVYCRVDSTIVLVTNYWLVLVKGWLESLWLLNILVYERPWLGKIFMLTPWLPSRFHVVVIWKRI